MGKKFALLFLIIVAFLSFLIFGQQGHIAHIEKALLSRSVYAEKIEVDWGLRPEIVLHNAKRQANSDNRISIPLSLSATTLRIRVNPFNWLSGRYYVDQISASNGQIGHYRFTSAQLDIQDFQSQQGAITLQNPTLIFITQQQEQHTFSAQSLAIQTGVDNVAELTQLNVNQQEFGTAKLQWHNVKESDSRLISGEFSACQTCRFSLNQRSQYTEFNIVDFPIELGFKAFKISPLFTGKSNINGVWFGEKAEGQIRLLVQNGELQGINLLQILANYLPFNTPTQGVDDSKFQSLSINMIQRQQGLQIEKVRLETPHFLMQGDGHIDPVSNQCELSFRFSTPIAEKLPVNLIVYDRCNAPRYRLKVDSDVKEQLKDLIRQRFRR